MFATAYAPREERVEIAGRLHDFDDFVRYADRELVLQAQEWDGTGTHQSIVDGYLPLHERRYGKPFVMPARAA